MPKVLILVLFLLPVFAHAQPKPALKTVLPHVLKEVSGLWIEDSDNYWLINDSGNLPFLYRAGADGVLKDSILLPVQNRDWEEITGDHHGHIYIGDFGNNRNARKDLRIYIYQPANGKLDSIQFAFPDQADFPPAKREDWSFDCEAMVAWHDSLHIFTKDAFAGPGRCKHYILPTKPGRYTANLKESILLKKSSVTGAVLDEKGERLALVSYHFNKFLGTYIFGRSNIHIFTDYTGGLYFNGRTHTIKSPYCLIARQFESIAFFNDRWLITAAEGVYFQKQQIRRKKITIQN